MRACVDAAPYLPNWPGMELWILPPLFSPNRAQPRRINSCFILILDFFRPELQDRQINTFC
jgi:hypothetical protein